MENELKKLLEATDRILVTSHISPDADAVSSLLLVSETLKTNYPDKEISAVLEEKPDQDLSFLAGYTEIIFAPLKDFIAKNPELIIIVDANKFERVSRNDWQEIRKTVIDNKIKTAIIDHHEEADKDDADMFINNHAPASAQEVYEVLFEKLELKKPDGFADITMLGIISDTRRFMYYDPMHRRTFSLVSDLIEAGADIEKLENRLSRFNPAQLEVISHLLANTISDERGYNYSHLTDEFAEKWQDDGKNSTDYRGGCGSFINQYLRNIGNNYWGFVVYPDLAGGPGTYSVSFRALHGTKDVSVLARKLGGGGHKSAAAAKFTEVSAVAALERVEQAINHSA